MSLPKPCGIGAERPVSEPRRVPVQDDDLARHHRKIMERYAAATIGLDGRALMTDQGNAQAVFRKFRDNAFLAQTARNVARRPGYGTRLERWLSRTMPSFLPEDSWARRARTFVMEARRFGESVWDDMPFWGTDMGDVAARWNSARRVEEMTSEMRKRMQAVGITRKVDQDEAYFRLMELSANRNIAQPGTYGRRVLDNEFDRIQREVFQKWGITDSSQIERLMEPIKGIADEYTNVYLVGTLAGASIGQVEGLGYVARNMKADPEWRLRNAKAVPYGVSHDDFGIRFAAAQSRKTFEYIVEDEILLAQALRKNSADMFPGIDDTVMSAALGGDDAARRQVSEAMTMVMTDDRILSHMFAKADLEQMDALADSGVLTKVPMAADRVFDVMKQTYDLPYAGLSELFVTDPVQGFQAYRRSLTESVQQSVTYEQIYTQGKRVGFAVDAQVYKANPAQYAGWVNTADIVGENAPFHYYLEPHVAETYGTIHKIATEPAAMNALSRTWHFLVQSSKYQMLTSFKFLSRNTLEAFTQAARAGANIADLPFELQRLLAVKQGNLDVLSDVRRYAGGTMSERDIYRLLQEQGRLSLSPQYLGGSLDSSLFGGTSNGANLFKYVMYNIKNHGVLDNIDYLGSASLRLQQETFTRLMGNISAVSDAALVNTVKTLLADDGLTRVGQFITTGIPRHFDTFDEALRHAGRYFYMYDDMGTWDNVIKQNLFPFWMYMSRSLPANINWMFREPRQFMNYARLYNALNGDLRDEGETLPEEGVPDYLMGTLPVFIRDPMGRPNHWVAIGISTVDPFGDAFKMVRSATKLGDMGLGWYHNQTADEIVMQQRGQGANPFQDIFNSLQGAYRAGYILATREDPFYGSSLDLNENPSAPQTILGMQAPGGNLAPVVSATIKSLVPVIGAVERANWFDVFGSREQRDEYGQVIREGTTSWAGVPGEQASESLFNQLAGRGTDPSWWVTAFREAGFVTKVFSAGREMQMTETDYHYQSQEEQSLAKRLRSQAAKTTDENKRNALLVEAAQHEAASILIMEAQDVAGGWLQEQGVPTGLERTSAIRADVAEQMNPQPEEGM